MFSFRKLQLNWEYYKFRKTIINVKSLKALESIYGVPDVIINRENSKDIRMSFAEYITKSKLNAKTSGIPKYQNDEPITGFYIWEKRFKYMCLIITQYEDTAIMGIPTEPLDKERLKASGFTFGTFVFNASKVQTLSPFNKCIHLVTIMGAVVLGVLEIYHFIGTTCWEHLIWSIVYMFIAAGVFVLYSYSNIIIRKK